jgi:dihydrofolate reductase
MFMMLSLDGFFEGPNHDISWHNVDDELNKFAIGQLKETGLMLWGRRTYQVMEEAWPRMAKDPATSKNNLVIADLINSIPKVCYSRTLDMVRETDIWRNVKLARGFDQAEIRRLKKQLGKDIWVGGSELATSFIEAGMIDEFRFMVNPVVIGQGTKIFHGLRARLDLKLVKTRRFDSGNVLHYYEPVSERPYT